MAIYRLLLFRWAPLIYLVTALPAAIFIAFLTPPFQTPGEDGHFPRAARIFGGVPADAARFAAAFSPLAGHPGAKLDPSVVASARTLSWAPDAAAPAAVAEPPVFLLPASAGLMLGRTFGLGLYDSASAGRILNAVVAVGLGALAIGMALHGRALLFVFLSLPTTLSLAGAIAPDATLTAGVALAVGLCSRAAGRDRPIGPWWRLLMAIIIGSAVATRPAYGPLLFLLLTGALRPGRPRSSFDGFLVALGPFCLAVAIVAGWLAFRSVSMHLPAETLRQPWPALWTMLSDTVMQAFVGLIGGDRPIPVAFTVAWLIALALAAGLSLVEEGDKPSLATGVVMLVCCALAGVAVFLTLAPAAPPDATAAVAGMQGRSLLPVATLLALAIPALAVWRRHNAYSAFGNTFAVVGWMAIFALAMVSDWLMMPAVLLNRFYL